MTLQTSCIGTLMEGGLTDGKCRDEERSWMLRWLWSLVLLSNLYQKEKKNHKMFSAYFLFCFRLFGTATRKYQMIFQKIKEGFAHTCTAPQKLLNYIHSKTEIDFFTNVWDLYIAMDMKALFSMQYKHVGICSSLAGQACPAKQCSWAFYKVSLPEEIRK